jgi:hypothetical protein
MYRPPFLTETKEAVWNDCTWRSGMMAVGKWSQGLLYPAEWTRERLIRKSEQMRDLVDTDDVGGATLAALSLGILRMWPGLRTHGPDDEGWDMRTSSEFAERLEAGCGMVLTGAEMGLPVYLRRWTNDDTFIHTVYVQGLKRIDERHQHGPRLCPPGVRHTYLMDPLGRGVYDGEWVPLTDILGFVTRLSLDRYYALVFPEGEVVAGEPPYFAVEEHVMLIANDTVRRSTKKLQVPAGTIVYKWPDGSIVRRLAEGGEFFYFGHPAGKQGWAAIRVRYEGDDVIAYIRKEGTTFIDAPEPIDPADFEEILERLDALGEELQGVKNEKVVLQQRLSDEREKVAFARQSAIGIAAAAQDIAALT